MKTGVWLIALAVLWTIPGLCAAKTFLRGCRVEVGDTWVISGSSASAADRTIEVDFLSMHGEVNDIVRLLVGSQHVSELAGASHPRILSPTEPGGRAIYGIEAGQPTCVVRVTFIANQKDEALRIVKTLKGDGS